MVHMFDFNLATMKTNLPHRKHHRPLSLTSASEPANTELQTIVVSAMTRNGSANND